MWCRIAASHPFRTVKGGYQVPTLVTVRRTVGGGVHVFDLW